ncbi:uncharacterized protein LOC18433025 [Amborella trichopoda]|nr:uncharacterized protein LOC18433025 [Amborella trichopoda]|eukprot:XP_006843184.2 uncharacterized protein LOC18433025 [Amborella trichopoda]
MQQNQQTLSLLTRSRTRRCIPCLLLSLALLALIPSLSTIPTLSRQSSSPPHQSHPLSPVSASISTTLSSLLSLPSPSPQTLSHIHLLQYLSHQLEAHLKGATEISDSANPKDSGISTPDFFLIEELRKYSSGRPNRSNRKNFMGANSTFLSMGHWCWSMKREMEEYMDYDVGELCEDDWRVGQRLMVGGCDPLPRRRCLARAPRWYTEPFAINESMWRVPDDRNVRWNGYICKNFTCLARNETRKGFFKCASCFDLPGHEKPRWIKIENSTENPSPDFLISDVLNIKPGEIRIGLDYSAGTGTFAARMREFNVTIVSATLNLGAPFNEMIALRGLVPLYLSLNQRLPFFDNTLDIIHTTRFLDGWIDFQLLDFVLFDWDRVLRPGGLLWIDSFFCSRGDLNDYLHMFEQFRYKKHRWLVVPKVDKEGDEVFFSAVLEKPPRPF